MRFPLHPVFLFTVKRNPPDAQLLRPPQTRDTGVRESGPTLPPHGVGERRARGKRKQEKQTPRGRRGGWEGSEGENGERRTARLCTRTDSFSPGEGFLRSKF